MCPPNKLQSMTSIFLDQTLGIRHLLVARWHPPRPSVAVLEAALTEPALPGRTRLSPGHVRCCAQSELPPR